MHKIKKLSIPNKIKWLKQIKIYNITHTKNKQIYDDM